MARRRSLEPELRPGPLALQPDAAELGESPPAVVWLAALRPTAGGAAPVPEEPGWAAPEPEAGPTEVPLDVAWLTVVAAVLVAPEAVETADCVAEFAVDPTEFVAEVAVDTADCTVEETAPVALEVDTGGAGTETGVPEPEPALTDGVETDGSPEARLEDAPDPTMAAGANVRTQIRISDFERFIAGVLSLLTRGGAKTFPLRTQVGTRGPAGLGEKLAHMSSNRPNHPRAVIPT